MQAFHFQASKCYQPSPFDSWALQATIPYDVASPGTLRRLFSTSPLRRQCWFHALSFLHGDCSNDFASRLQILADPNAWTTNRDGEIARTLLTRRIRDIVRALHGEARGLVGALSRIGDQPLSPTAYRALTSILKEQHHQERARVLQRSSKVTSASISVLLALQPPWIRDDLVGCLRSPDDVAQFTSAVELIRYLVPNVTDEALIQSLNSDVSLGQWADRWVQKASRFPIDPPISDGGEFVLLGSARAIRDAARRYRNCLLGRLAEVATGRVAFVEHVPSQTIIELKSLSAGQWLLETLNAPVNRGVKKQVASAMCRKLQAVGVLVPARLSHAKQYASTGRLLNIWDSDGLSGNLVADGDNPDLSELEAELDEVARELGVSEFA